MSGAGERVKEISKMIETEMPGRHFNNDLGLELEDFDEEYGAVPIAAYIYTAKERHLNNYDALHGGIIASIFDTAAGLGAAALTESKVTTTDLSVTFLRPAMGERFRIIVEYDHVGSNLVSATSKIYSISDDPLKGDVLCASCIASYFVLKLPIDNW